VHRDQFLKGDRKEFHSKLTLASAKCGAQGWVLILLDADDDCPAAKAPEILERALAVLSHRRLSVVLAQREYEAWFIAAASSINGQRGFQCAAGEAPPAPEGIRDAKGWLGERMVGSYHERMDQPAFSARLDLALAHERSRSFRKLCREWRRQVTGLS
jgi:hypothetical protein